MLLSVFIDEKLYHFNEEISILEACNSVGIKLPRFCYHENLSIAGNCRMCLVEVEKSIKPIVACSTDIAANMTIFTKSSLVLKARENILEFLLLNHPLDCPICDQAGECDLQDQAIYFGSNFSRNYFSKRSVEDKICDNVVKTIMNRCIHCTRCVRFGEEICGLKFFGTLNRGLKTEIGAYLIKLSLSEISANVVDLCPVGALTLKTIPFQTRPWELYSIESIDLSDCVGSNIYLLYKGLDILKIVPKKNILINDSWISNKARFYFNITYFKQINKCFLNTLQLPCLFLLNSDLDLNTLYYLKKKSVNYLTISSKLLNSTSLKSNIYFWGIKTKIFSISNVINGICFLISSNLQLEASILNIKLRYKIISNAISAFSFSFFKSNFPLKFLKFSILEVIFLLLGKHFFLSKFFFKFNLLFFSNKSILDRIDVYFFNILNYKIPQNLFFNVSGFCNNEGANYLNFKKFNFKEFCFSNQIFGLNLDDTFILRKLICFNNKFFWLNQFSSNILSFFTSPVWISLDINQMPGFYLNIEQRIQKMSLLKSTFKFTIITVLQVLFNTFYLAPHCIAFFLTFNKFFLKFSYLIENYVTPILFNTLSIYFSFFNSLFNFSFNFYYKQAPIKSVFEDPYRTSLQLKYSLPLVKSSQLFRTENIF